MRYCGTWNETSLVIDQRLSLINRKDFLINFPHHMIDPCRQMGYHEIHPSKITPMKILTKIPFENYNKVIRNIYKVHHCLFYMHDEI
jgi:hypothetical protein